MLAYDRNKLNIWINRLMVRDAASNGMITEEEKNRILLELPQPFFSPRLILRVALGFATLVAVSTFMSAIGLFQGQSMLNLVYGASLLWLLELLIKKKHHFRSGVDDILLYQGFALVITGMISWNGPYANVFLALFASIFAGACSIRYLDRLMTGISLISLLVAVALLFHVLNPTLLLYFPFAVFTLSSGALIVAAKVEQQPKFIYHRHCLEFIRLISLLLLGLFTNLFFIDEFWFGEVLRGEPPREWKIFYSLTTFIVPLVTFISGFRWYDKLRIRIGALMVVAGVVTFHYYVTNIPREVLAVVYGLLLFGAAYLIIRYFKSNAGISFQERNENREVFEWESILIGAGADLVLPETLPPKEKGGSFGGAGAGGEF